MPTHDHTWRTTAHVDGCHFFITVAACDCGAVYRLKAERDPADDPYAVVWFLDDCERCNELAAGAKPTWDAATEEPAR